MKTKMSKRLLAMLMALILTLSVATPGFVSYAHEKGNDEPGFTTDYNPPYSSDEPSYDDGHDNGEDGEPKPGASKPTAPDYLTEENELLPATLPTLVEISPHVTAPINASLFTALQSHTPPLPSDLFFGANHVNLAVAASLEALDLRYNGLTSVEGIQYFTGLRVLQLEYNNLTTINLTANTALEELFLLDNNLSTINLTANTALRILDVRDNNLTTLNLTTNTALTGVWAHGNNLNSIDVSNNLALRELYVFENNLSSINVSNNLALESLSVRDNNLSSINVNANTALRSLWLRNNNISSINVSNNTALTFLSVHTNNLNSINVSSNTALVTLRLQNNNLDTINVTANTALEELNVHGNNLSVINVSNNTALEELDVAGNNLTSISLTNNTALTQLDVSNNYIPGLSGVVNNPVTGTNFIFNPQRSITPPTIAGGVASVYLMEGYATAYQSVPFTITYPLPLLFPPTVTMTASPDHGGRITWNQAASTLNIATGLPAGVYTAVLSVDNSQANGGAVVTRNITITVDPPIDAQTPAVIQQPLSKIATVDDAVTLRVEARITDGGALTYQWYSNTVNNNTGGTVIPGATSFSFVPPTDAIGTVYYYVVITNTNAAATGNTIATAVSATASVTLNPPTNAQIPNITTQPQNVTVQQNVTAELTVVASVTDGGTLTYQWYSSPLDGAGSIAIPGATNPSFNPPTSVVGAMYYYVVVTNTYLDATNNTVARANSTPAMVVTTAIGGPGPGPGGGGFITRAPAPTTGGTEDCPLPRVWVVPSDALTAEWQELLGDYAEYLEIIIETSAANRPGGYVTAAISFTIDNEELNRLLTTEMPRILQIPNSYFTIFADLLCAAPSDQNYYRITAFQGDRLLGGSIKSSEDMIFSVRAYSPGTFTIAYVENLRRLVMPLDSYVIIDLAQNAPNKTMDVLPMIQNDQTLVPIRFIAEALGAEVDWTSATATGPMNVHITVDGQTLSFGIGETSPQLAALGMDVPAQLIGDRTMVPLRFVSEFFGAIVEWDGDTRVIEIINIGSVLNTNQNTNPTANQTASTTDSLDVLARDEDEDRVIY